MKNKSLRLIISIVLVCIIAVSALSFTASAEDNFVLDLVYVIDTSKNTEEYIDDIKANIVSGAERLESSDMDYRVAFIEYRDFTNRTSEDDFAYKTTEFFTESQSIIDYANSITLSEYGNPNSCLFSSLIEGLGAFEWREGAGRAIVVIGENPPYDPEPYTGYNLSDISIAFSPAIDETLTESKFTFFTVNLSSNEETATTFGYLSEITNGKYYELGEETDISGAISSIFDDIIKVIPDVVNPAVDTFWDSVAEFLTKAPGWIVAVIDFFLDIVIAFLSIL